MFDFKIENLLGFLILLLILILILFACFDISQQIRSEDQCRESCQAFRSKVVNQVCYCATDFSSWAPYQSTESKE